MLSFGLIKYHWRDFSLQSPFNVWVLNFWLNPLRMPNFSKFKLIMQRERFCVSSVLAGRLFAHAQYAQKWFLLNIWIKSPGAYSLYANKLTAYTECMHRDPNLIANCPIDIFICKPPFRANRGDLDLKLQNQLPRKAHISVPFQGYLRVVW